MMMNYEKFSNINKNIIFIYMYQKSKHAQVNLTLADKNFYIELVKLCLKKRNFTIERNIKKLAETSIYSKSTIVKSLKKLEQLGAISRIKVKKIFKPIGNNEYQTNKPYLTKIDRNFLGGIFLMNIKDKLNNEEQLIINTFFDNGIEKKIELLEFLKHLDFTIATADEEDIKVLYLELKEKLSTLDNEVWNKLLLELPFDLNFDNDDVEVIEELE